MYSTQCKSFSLSWHKLSGSLMLGLDMSHHKEQPHGNLGQRPLKPAEALGGRCETAATWAVSYSCVCHNFFFFPQGKSICESPRSLSGLVLQKIMYDIYIALPQPFSCPVYKYIACRINLNSVRCNASASCAISKMSQFNYKIKFGM